MSRDPKKHSKNWGGKRDKSGPTLKSIKVPPDPEIAALKLKVEKLLIADALPLAYKAMIKALDSDNPFALVKYILDRVYGKPREADKLTGADEALRRELAISEAQKRVELLGEQIALAKLQREDKEKRQGPATQGKEEGRFYPAGGEGVGPCGKYHALFDSSLYPLSPFVRPDLVDRIKAGLTCALCGDPRFVVPVVATPLPSQPEDLFEDDADDELEDEEEVDD